MSSRAHANGSAVRAMKLAGLLAAVGFMAPAANAAVTATQVTTAADIGIGQRGGRLVHDQEARVLRQRLGDLDALAIGDREAADARVDIEIVAVEIVE